MARYRTVDSTGSLPARDLLARERMLIQQARLGQSVRLRYRLVAMSIVVGIVGFSTGAFTIRWPLFFVFGVLGLIANIALDVARRRGEQRSWHFWAMLVADTLLIGGNAMALGHLGYLTLPFLFVAAVGHSLGFPRAARLQIILACVVYPLSRFSGLWLEGVPITLATAGLVAIETVCLGGLGWVAIIGPIRFTYRLRRTRRALRDLEHGIFDTRLPTGALDDLGFLAVSFNRTAEALAEAEAELLEREAELRQVHKLEAVGRLAGGVAHDFNNYLTVVLANLELASTELPIASAAHADIREAVRAARAAAELTKQLLAFGRKQLLKPETVDVCATVRELAPMMSRLVEGQVRIVTDLASTPCLARADAAQLGQVVLNLVTNARDAMGIIGGTLTVTVRPERLEEARARGVAVIIDDDAHRRRAYAATKGDAPLTDEWIMLSVRDTGVGMDAETLANVFEPFFTTKRIGMGSGLGLSTVHGIVAQSGGAVAVESAPGAGTTFSVYLPAVRPGAALPQRPVLGEIVTPSRPFPRMTPPAERNAGVVLLVEDEPSVRISTRRILERAGYSVVEAADGMEALKRFASRELGAPDDSGPPVQILVTDLMMPRLGGAELATRLRASRPDLPVILMSGYSEDAVLAEGVPLPGALFIAKPPHREELVAAVAELLKGGPLVTAH